MLRYHKKVFIPDEHINLLATFTNIVNGRTWTYSAHCMDNIKYRLNTVELSKLLTFIKTQTLRVEDIFEYYLDGQGIAKSCYRISYTRGLDIILVVSDTKNLITIYLNDSEDSHVTLHRNLYVQK
jgi:hypothetical protein